MQTGKMLSLAFYENSFQTLERKVSLKKAREPYMEWKMEREKELSFSPYPDNRTWESPSEIAQPKMQYR